MWKRNYPCIDLGLENKFSGRRVHSKMPLVPSEKVLMRRKKKILTFKEQSQEKVSKERGLGEPRGS